MTVDYVPIANGATADVESQAQYLIDLAPGGTLDTGFRTGTALSAQFNKVVRQSSVMSASLANFIAEELLGDVLDDGDVPALVLKIRAAIIAAVGNPFSTGDLKLTMKTVADAGWVLCNDGNIGSATSGATTRANADCQALFTLLWTNVTNTYAPVLPGGHGVSAAADWAANKTIGLTKMLGRALAVYGAGGGGLTARVMGETLGEETHALTVNEGPSHNHTLNDPGHTHSITDPGHFHYIYNASSDLPHTIYGVDVNDGKPLGGPYFDTDTGLYMPFAFPQVTGITIDPTSLVASGLTIQNSGSSLAHNNMQPTSFVNAMIKL